MADDLFAVFEPVAAKKRTAQTEDAEDSNVPAVKRVCFDNDSSSAENL